MKFSGQFVLCFHSMFDFKKQTRLKLKAFYFVTNFIKTSFKAVKLIKFITEIKVYSNSQLNV